jgi:hypothetical protein
MSVAASSERVRVIDIGAMWRLAVRGASQPFPAR